ncbi:DUF2213 domain-containing protein [Xenorhabdus bovienii]|uniref:DUF2213 domain-containing protein n=1 Tax=Xenorhabdus bovienii TaxID=40576 RepID=A0AAJ1N2V6_XENBV|nr:DUF2213 domain-containing protein [Xenorhabdus bovienii]MDE1479967.1 DUF2213 domain-containing protein [Xenorhabdus bovienii]MDE9511664.1 DUF2213 domain-containing protein [Xenorhabdus bovienii]MDE9523306.1 DUF2213 domain-containing protein [Xenorhabdus bovienii]
MTMTDRLAFDRSIRSKDGNGHLIVERTILSKAAVNPYRGKEIPGYERLGLDPEKVYHLLRDPLELERAAKTFSKKQLLIKHIPVDSSEPQKEYTIGAIGSDISFEDGRLYGDLSVWDGYAIDLIESGKMQELSAGYGYTPDMTPGEYEGQHYDGVMRNIFGNHVALVERGRIGRDAIISDHQTVDLETEMKLKPGATPIIAAQIKQALAMDADLSEDSLKAIITAVTSNLAQDEDPAAIKGAKDNEQKPEGAKDNDPKAPEGSSKPEGAKDNDPKTEVAKDQEEKDKDKAKDNADKPAMDAAMIEQRAVERVTALFQARDDVKPLVGVVAMDSAEQVYGYALKQKGVDTTGVHASAYKSMVGMLLSNQVAATKPNVAMDHDSFADDKLTARFG